VEVNPIFKSQLKWSTYKKVPVVLMDGQPMTDSSAIISHLAAAVSEQKQEEVAPQRAWWGRTKQKAKLAEEGETDQDRTWREWVDQRLVKVNHPATFVIDVRWSTSGSNVFVMQVPARSPLWSDCIFSVFGTTY
jgi:hypothetical protein